ncbi:unnamed protein product [Phytophthora fragariaefolia]|uniref:Unnamed protein product n=1 Tax=Phytophthora fragariaefolia TaxID=1490495 RepID=A0A9W6XS82_9STRA|nr:unnamed protein product [Phytophthora fragariaefolia]
MVKSRGNIVHDLEVTARDLSFKSVWRELRGQGWTRKPPPRRGLDDRYFYLRPGGDASGADGVDFFRGEEAVLDPSAQSTDPAPASAWDTPARVASTSVCASGDAQIAVAAEVVRLNYFPDIEAAEARARAREAATTIANSPQPSLRPTPPMIPAGAVAHEAPVAALFREAQSAPTTPVPRQAPGKRPARRSVRRSLEEATRSTASRTPPRPSQVLIAASPHMTDEDSADGEDEDDLESSADLALSNGAASDGTSGEVNRMLNDMLSVMHALGNELLADNNDDLNTVGDDDNEPQYGAMESGDEAEKGDIETGEFDSDEGMEPQCAPDDDHDDPEETEQEITAEVLFAENFSSHFGGEDEVLAGNLKTRVLREMSATGWEDVVAPDTAEYLMTPYEPVNGAGSYPGIRQGYSGPTADVLRRGDSPLALFFYFMPVVLW